MNFDQMKLVDYCVGGLLCALIGFTRKVFFPVDPSRKLAALPVRSIAVLKFLGMGSILQAIPMIAALRERFPGARLTLVTSADNRAFAHLVPYFDEVLTIELSRPLGLARDLVRTLARLRAQRLDLLLDLEFFSNFSGFYSAFAGATWSVGFATPKSFRNWIYCEVVSFDHGRHIADIFYKVARALGLPPKPVAGARALRHLLDSGRLKLDRPATERAVDDALRAGGWTGKRPLVVVNVNAGPLNLNRRWPLESFATLIGQLQARGASVALIGGRAESAYVADLIRRLADRTNVHDLSGQVDVAGLILLLARADLYLGNDSGPLHLAESVGTRTVSFFGPETPRLYGPVGPEHLVFYKELPCSPCLNVYNQKSSDCGDNQCLKQITVDEVAAGVVPVVESLGKEPACSR